MSPTGRKPCRLGTSALSALPRELGLSEPLLCARPRNPSTSGAAIFKRFVTELAPSPDCCAIALATGPC